MDDEEKNLASFFRRDSPIQGEEKTEKKSKHKRKRTEEKVDEEIDGLRDRAKFLCTCAEEWKQVSKYNSKRLEEFVQERVYMQNKALSESVFDQIHALLALGLDKVSRGDGYVEEKVLANQNLRKSLEEEGQNFIFLLTNKIRILTLILLDVHSGKRTQRKNQPVSAIHIEEEKGSDSGQHQEQAQEAQI